MLSRDVLIAALTQRANITLHMSPEDMSPVGHFYDATDVSWIHDELRRGNEWAWCCTHVRASFAGLTGDCYLGGCSYASEADFRADGYYADMVAEAIAELTDRLLHVAEQVNALCQTT